MPAVRRRLFRWVVEKIKESLNLETLDDNPPATSASNETSVVQMATFGSKRVLLTGDVGPEGLGEAAQFPSAVDVMKEP
jgi:beta-lactamase superfamily II metal-dependent hydrolase